MPKYKNIRCMEFVKDGSITPVTNIDHYLKKCRTVREKMLLILLFITGARSSEIIQLKSDDIIKDGTYLSIHLKTMKRGRNRILKVPMRNGTSSFVKYSRMLLKLVDDTFLTGQNIFPAWSNVKIHKIISRVTNEELNPYFFRHNVMSILSMSGASIQQIQFWKGAKDVKSVQPYLHISREEQTKIGNILQNVNIQGGN